MASKHKQPSSAQKAQSQSQKQSPPVGESAAANEQKKKPHANPERTPAPPADKEWREHEHQTPATHAQAKQLLDEAGSPELAKHAVEQAHDQEQPRDDGAVHVSDSDKDAAARQLGYESFAALVQDSASFPGERNRIVLVCELKDGRWIRFDRESWPIFEAFATRDEAVPKQKQDDAAPEESD